MEAKAAQGGGRGRGLDDDVKDAASEEMRDACDFEGDLGAGMVGDDGPAAQDGQAALLVGALEEEGVREGGVGVGEGGLEGREGVLIGDFGQAKNIGGEGSQDACGLVEEGGGPGLGF